MPVGSVRFARNCGKMFSCHFCLYGGLCSRSAFRHSEVEKANMLGKEAGGGGGGWEAVTSD